MSHTEILPIYQCSFSWLVPTSFLPQNNPSTSFPFFLSEVHPPSYSFYCYQHIQAAIIFGLKCYNFLLTSLPESMLGHLLGYSQHSSHSQWQFVLLHATLLLWCSETFHVIQSKSLSNAPRPSRHFFSGLISSTDSLSFCSICTWLPCCSSNTNHVPASKTLFFLLPRTLFLQVTGCLTPPFPSATPSVSPFLVSLYKNCNAPPWIPCFIFVLSIPHYLYST